MTLSKKAIVFRYAVFAAIAISTNLLAQSICGLILGHSALLIPLIAGTLAGFGTKYVLDKLFIFFDELRSAQDEARKIFKYGLSAILTTGIFWTCEIGAWSLFGTVSAKYIGAFSGLVIGYVMKYWLDKHLVFVKAHVRHHV